MDRNKMNYGHYFANLAKNLFLARWGFMAQIRHLKRVKNAIAWVHFEDFFLGSKCY